MGMSVGMPHGRRGSDERCEGTTRSAEHQRQQGGVVHEVQQRVVGPSVREVQGLVDPVVQRHGRDYPGVANGLLRLGACTAAAAAMLPSSAGDYCLRAC